VVQVRRWSEWALRAAAADAEEALTHPCWEKVHSFRCKQGKHVSLSAQIAQQHLRHMPECWAFDSNRCLRCSVTVERGKKNSHFGFDLSTLGIAESHPCVCFLACTLQG
jgi:hypothetical protein